MQTKTEHFHIPLCWTSEKSQLKIYRAANSIRLCKDKSLQQIQKKKFTFFHEKNVGWNCWHFSDVRLSSSSSSSLFHLICTLFAPIDLFPENNWIAPVAKKQKCFRSGHTAIAHTNNLPSWKKVEINEEMHAHTERKKEISKVSRTKNNDRSWTYFQLTFF